MKKLAVVLALLAVSSVANAAMVGMQLDTPVSALGHGWVEGTYLMVEVDILTGDYTWFDGTTYLDQDGNDLTAAYTPIGAASNFALFQGGTWAYGDHQQINIEAEALAGITNTWCFGDPAWTTRSVYTGLEQEEMWFNSLSPDGTTFGAANDWSSTVGLGYGYDGYGQIANGTCVVGMRFNLVDGVHYGWAQLGFDGWNNGRYLGFAYNDVAGEAAVADWNVVSPIIPEPATMSLLAIGGIAALIRRKK